MVNPPGIFPKMFPFDHDEETILTLWIQVLRSYPFWGKVFQSVVFLVAETKSSFCRHNKNTEFLSSVLPPISDNFESHIHKSCVKMDPRLARKRGTGQEWEWPEGRYQVYPEEVDELVGTTTFPVCPFEA